MTARHVYRVLIKVDADAHTKLMDQAQLDGIDKSELRWIATALKVVKMITNRDNLIVYISQESDRMIRRQISMKNDALHSFSTKEGVTMPAWMPGADQSGVGYPDSFIGLLSPLITR